jgi:hypothetical protein
MSQSTMKPRSFIPLIIGVAASLVGFVSVSALRQNRCGDAGGRWDDATRVCNVDGVPLDVARPLDVIIGIAVAVLLAFMLHRASTFVGRYRASVTDG